MELCLIHADEHFTELAELYDFDSFSAIVTLKTDADCDWELTLPEGSWSKCPIMAGHHIYIEGTEWGGPVERVRHISSEGRMKLQGTCWRGLLNRRVISPAAGGTHFVLEEQESNSAIAVLLGNWQSDLFTVSSEDSGLLSSVSLRYATLQEAIDAMLEASGGRLSVTFADGKVTLSAGPIRDMTDQVELSQEYDAQLITDSSVRLYNHIIALGSGELLERQVVELWLRPDGTVTDDPQAAEDIEHLSTMLYDYSAVESLDALAQSARRKLLAQAGQSSMEIEMTDDIGLDLTDRALVRDTLTGMTATLRVISRELTVSSSGVTITHCLG